MIELLKYFKFIVKNLLKDFGGQLTETQHMLPGKFLLIAALAISFLLAAIFISFFFLFRRSFMRFIIGPLAILVTLLFLAGTGAYFYMSQIEPNWIQVEEVSLEIPNLGDVTKGLKIAQFSDLHTFKFGLREERLVKIINELNPDIILFTGGFTGDDFENIGEGKKGAIKVFSLINKPKMGIWAVMDDTDYGLFKDESFRKGIEKAGVRLLFNEAKKIHIGQEKYFWLAGAEDAFYGRNGVPQTMYMVPLKEPKIMITHSPNITKYINDYNIELILVGKTHGGQIGLPILREISSYVGQFEYIRGLYKVGRSYLYVNRGIGVKTSTYRFMCRPEITVFRIDGAQSHQDTKTP